MSVPWWPWPVLCMNAWCSAVACLCVRIGFAMERGRTSCLTPYCLLHSAFGPHGLDNDRTRCVMTGAECWVPVILLDQAVALTLALASRFLIWRASLCGDGRFAAWKLIDIKPLL